MRSSIFFETLSIKELGRLCTIVASSASIAWAGQLAQTNESFAEREITRNTELLQALTERAEMLPVGPKASDERIKDALDDFDESVLLAKHALEKFKSSNHKRRAFNEENLKSQIFRLQDSARKTQGLFIARESSQSFNVSRTGQ